MRTADGRLHVVWPSADPGSYSLHYSTVGPSAKLLATGTILSHWGAIDQFPGSCWPRTASRNRACG